MLVKVIQRRIGLEQPSSQLYVLSRLEESSDWIGDEDISVHTRKKPSFSSTAYRQ